MKPINVYSNKDISISFDAKRCVNSGMCAKGLSSVVKSSLLPWNSSSRHDSEKIAEQINRCPSGALMVSIKKKETAEAV